jgi:hypothetical protein
MSSPRPAATLAIDNGKTVAWHTLETLAQPASPTGNFRQLLFGRAQMTDLSSPASTIRQQRHGRRFNGGNCPVSGPGAGLLVYASWRRLAASATA